MFRIFFLLLVTFFLSPLYAQQQQLLDPYFIARIEMNAFDKNEVIAKQKAIDGAMRQAFDILMQRLIYDGQKRLDINYIGERYLELPYISKTPFLDESEKIEDFIDSQSIHGEKFGGGHYLGFLDVQFNRFQIRQLLEKRKIPYVDKAGLPLVIFPIIKQNQQYILWDSNNQWLNIWRDLPILNSVIPTMIALGDEFDRQALANAEQVLSNGILEHNMRKLLWRYRAGGYAIALLDITKDNLGQDFHQLRLIINAPGWNLQQLIPIDPYIGNLTDQNQYYRYLAYRLRQQIEDLWHKLHYQSQGDLPQEKITARVKIKDLKHWLNIRQSLYQAIGKDNVHIQDVMVSYANIGLSYSNNVDILIASLAQYDIALDFDSVERQWWLDKADR